MDALSDEHYAQTVKFLKFFRSKRELALEQIQCDFDDTKNDSLTEDMYTKEEVHVGYDSMSNVVKDTARTEMGTMINMTVLLLAQLFEGADEQDATLEMNTSVIEDQRMLEEVEKMTMDRQTRTAGKGARLKDTFAQCQKDLMQTQSKLDLTEGKLSLTEKKLIDQEATTKKQKKELKSLKKKVKELAVWEQLKEKDGPAVGNTSVEQESKESESKQQDIEEEQTAEDEALEEEKLEEELADCSKDDVIRKLKASKKRIKYLNNEMDKRLRDSKQFQQLQKLMQGKNKELVDLRDRLVRYEPEGIEEDEDI